MPRLDFYADHKLFVKIRLGKRTVRIGRASDCDVQLPDERVSRHHARIEPRDSGAYWIEDLSANGIRVNAAKIDQRAELRPGDRIYIQDSVVIYQPDDAPPVDLEREPTRQV